MKVQSQTAPGAAIELRVLGRPSGGDLVMALSGGCVTLSERSASAVTVAVLTVGPDEWLDIARVLLSLLGRKEARIPSSFRSAAPAPKEPKRRKRIEQRIDQQEAP